MIGSSSNPPEERAQTVAARNGMAIEHLRARQVTTSDFHDFDHVIALDNQNLRDLMALRPAKAAAKLSLLFDHVAGRTDEDVAAAFYGGGDGFD